MNRYLVQVGVGSMPRQNAEERLKTVKEQLAPLAQPGEIWAYVTTTDHTSVQIELMPQGN